MCWAGLVSYSHISYLLLRSATVWTVKYCNKQFLNYVLKVSLKSPKLRKDHCSHSNVMRLVSCLWHQTTKLRVSFFQIFSSSFSQFEHLKKKTNCFLPIKSFVEIRTGWSIRGKQNIVIRTGWSKTKIEIESVKMALVTRFFTLGDTGWKIQLFKFELRLTNYNKAKMYEGPPGW